MTAFIQEVCILHFPCVGCMMISYANAATERAATLGMWLPLWQFEFSSLLWWDLCSRVTCCFCRMQMTPGQNGSLIPIALQYL